MKFLTREILSFYKIRENAVTDNWYLEKLFSNTKEVGLYKTFRKNVISSRRTGEDDSLETLDEVNTYEINSIGCRGKIDEDSEILGCGCSITYGLGVPEDGRWTNLLGKKINKSITNLANPGDSIETICMNIIQYCLNTKMPKEIFCFFPDFFRSKIVVDKEFYKSKVNRGAIGTRDDLEYIFCNPKITREDKQFYMEIEDKGFVEDSTSPHQLILNSINFIYILEAFCLSNNIKLFWTTWDVPSSLILEELSKMKNFKLKNFTLIYPSDLRYPGLGSFVNNNCNANTHEHEFKDHICWENGSDYYFINGEKTFLHSHPGIHIQEHVAEFFYNLHKEHNEDNQDSKD